MELIGYSRGGAAAVLLAALSLPFIPSAAEILELFIATGYPFQHV
jgi:hypothetical protein